ncbi:hypothetical protein Pelo_13220 [Pelomyxa schiedti]|nr:hypothetical protein Pelo_13220 [Pelomyxa schiedti]
MISRVSVGILVGAVCVVVLALIITVCVVVGGEQEASSKLSFTVTLGEEEIVDTVVDFYGRRFVGDSPFLEDSSQQLNPSYSVYGGTIWPEQCGPACGGSWLYGTVITDIDTLEMIGFIHQEDWYCNSTNPNHMAWASIAMATSYNLGETWTLQGDIITSGLPEPATPAWGGAGSNSVYYNATTKCWYMVYSEVEADGASRLHSAKSADPHAWAGNWFKWKNSAGFVEPGTGGFGDAIAFDWEDQGGSPSVHFNSYLGLYVMVYAGWDGALRVTSCTDLDQQDWAQPEVILKVSDSIGGGDQAFPTIISLEGGDQTAGQTARLYYADFNSDRTVRVFAFRNITFSPL